MEMRAQGNTHVYRMNGKGLGRINKLLAAPERAVMIGDVEADAWERKVLRDFLEEGRLKRDSGVSQKATDHCAGSSPSLRREVLPRKRGERGYSAPPSRPCDSPARADRRETDGPRTRDILAHSGGGREDASRDNRSVR